jgi:hypothetical protein
MLLGRGWMFMGNINARLLKLLVIFTGIPLLIFATGYILKDTEIIKKYMYSIEKKIGLDGKPEENPVLSKDDIKKYGRFVLSEHNKLYTAKTDRQYDMLLKSVYLEAGENKEEAGEIYAFSKKNKIGKSIISIDGGEEKVKQGERTFTYSNKIHRLLLYGDGREFIQTAKVSIIFAKDETDRLYKIETIDFIDTELTEAQN